MGAPDALHLGTWESTDVGLGKAQKFHSSLLLPESRHVSWNIVADSRLESRPLGRYGTYVPSSRSGSLGVEKPLELFKRTQSWRIEKPESM